MNYIFEEFNNYTSIKFYTINQNSLYKSQQT